MKVHEKHCTNNPHRACRVCDNAPDIQSTIAALRLAGSIQAGDRGELTSESFKAVQAAVENCPACTLAVVRQIGVFPQNCSYKDSAQAYLSEKRSVEAENATYC